MSQIDVPLLCIPRGPRCKGSISVSAHISHRFIRRYCSVPRAGSAQTQPGFHLGSSAGMAGLLRCFEQVFRCFELSRG